MNSRVIDVGALQGSQRSDRHRTAGLFPSHRGSALRKPARRPPRRTTSHRRRRQSGLGNGIGPIGARAFTKDRVKALRRAIGLRFGIAAVAYSSSPPSTASPSYLSENYSEAWGFSFEQAGFSLAAALSAMAGGQILDLYPDISQPSILGFGFLALVPGVVWLAR